MNKNIFETLMGAVVLAVAIGFISIAYNSGRVSNVDGYALTAKFDRVDGLTVGSDVRVSGLKVGQIISQTIDPVTYQAIVRFGVDNQVKLPKDSSAEILSNGLLGNKYLALVPGGEEDTFSDGDEVEFTQAAISLESIIGKFMFGEGSNGDETTTDTQTSGDESGKSEDDIF